MIIITARMRAVPGKEAMLESAIRDVVAATAAEPGAVRYVASRDMDDPATFYFVEEWADKAVMREHFGTAHLAEFQTAGKECIAEQEVYMHTVENSRQL